MNYAEMHLRESSMEWGKKKWAIVVKRIHELGGGFSESSQNRYITVDEIAEDMKMSTANARLFLRRLNGGGKRLLDYKKDPIIGKPGKQFRNLYRISDKAIRLGF